MEKDYTVRNISIVERSRLESLTGSYLIDLCKVSPNVCIAGGATLFVLDSQVPYESVGNINIFILDRDIDTFIEVTKKVHAYLSNAKPPKEYTFQVSNSSTLFIISGGIDIYPVLTNYQSPNDLISNFDMDYVQCAYNQGKIYTTPWFLLAKYYRMSMYYDRRVPISRIDKANRKGYGIVYCKSEEVVSVRKQIKHDLGSDLSTTDVPWEKIIEQKKFKPAYFPLCGVRVIPWFKPPSKPEPLFPLKFFEDREISRHFSNHILRVDGEEIHVNKSVLMNDSTFFQRFFTTNIGKKDSSVSDITGIRYCQLNNIIKFLHGKNIGIDLEEMMEYWALAHHYDIESLKSYVLEAILTRLPLFSLENLLFLCNSIDHSGSQKKIVIQEVLRRSGQHNDYTKLIKDSPAFEDIFNYLFTNVQLGVPTLKNIEVTESGTLRIEYQENLSEPKNEPVPVPENTGNVSEDDYSSGEE